MSEIKMPFGNYKGLFLDDVPASYLKWLSQQDWIDKFPSLKKYIDDNMNGINKQIEDGYGDI